MRNLQLLLLPCDVVCMSGAFWNTFTYLKDRLVLEVWQTLEIPALKCSGEGIPEGFVQDEEQKMLMPDIGTYYQLDNS